MISSTDINLHEGDKPRVAAVKHDGSDAPKTPQTHRFYLEDRNIDLKVGSLYSPPPCY